MRVIEQMMTVPLPAPRVSAGPIILALVLGPAVALLSAWWPARQAARRPPLEVLCERPGAAAARSHGASRWTLCAGLSILLLGAVFVAGVFLQWFSKELYVYLLPAVMFLGLFSCAALSPWILPPSLSLAHALLKPLLGIEAGLAVRQLRRHPVRTALVVGVLAVSVLVAVGFGQVILISIDDVHDWGDKVISADFLVRAHLPEPSTLMTGAMPETLAEDIAELAGVEHVGKLAFIPARAAGLDVIVLARTWTANEDEPLGIDLIEGEAGQVRRSLLAGQVVIGSHLALQAGLDIGGTLPLETRHGLRELTVAGIATEYTGGGTVLYGDWALMKDLLQPIGVHAFLVNAKRAGGTAAGASLDDVAAALQAFCREHGVIAQPRAGFRASLDQMMAGVLGSFWALMGLVFVVASLGVTNAVTMNVLEQTREIGILRAVAMRRRQVCRMVLAQALMLGAGSLLPGAAGGVLLSLLVVATTYPITGLVYEFRFRPVFMAGCLLLALVIAAAASIPPLIRVARLSVVRALQYE
jgi:putative ABC transport system permease protein